MNRGKRAICIFAAFWDPYLYSMGTFFRKRHFCLCIWNTRLIYKWKKCCSKKLYIYMFFSFPHMFHNFSQCFFYTFPHTFSIFHKYSYIFIFVPVFLQLFRIFYIYLPIFVINKKTKKTFHFSRHFSLKFSALCKRFRQFAIPFHQFFLRDFKNIYKKNVHLIIMT